MKKALYAILVSGLLIILCSAQSFVPVVVNTFDILRNLYGTNGVVVDVNTNNYTVIVYVTNGVPTGGVIEWYGSIASIPSGWHLCDGSAGTPDLRNKFIVCANADISGVAKTTLTGAATQSGGSISHNHSITDAGHTHNIDALEFFPTGNGGVANGSDYGTATGGGPYSALFDGTDGNPNMSSVISTETTGITVNSVDAPQPYFALAYIMKQ